MGNSINNHPKNINLYGYSRFKSYQRCPQAHYYEYVEGIEIDSGYHATFGLLFHLAVEEELSNRCGNQVPYTAIKTFKDLCLKGQLQAEPDLLEYIVNAYFEYYAKEYAAEQLLLIEETIEDDLTDNNKFSCTIDQYLETNGLNLLRDIKTTTGPLKYEYEDVLNNQQLLLYSAYVEDYTQTKVNILQIDEVRIAKLMPVPFTTRNKPSIDKKRLELVTYEAYLDALQQQNLETAPEYQAILDYLCKRGHPLFNRISIQLVDPNIPAANAEDMLNTYNNMLANQQAPFRNRGSACKYCGYRELCQLDMSNPSTTLRLDCINNLQKPIDKI